MTLTKADMADNIREKLESFGFTRKKSIESVEALLEIVKRTMEDGEDILISGFGKFCVKEKRERRGRNPASGEDLMLRPRRVVTFRCSGKLRKKINEKRREDEKRK
jgi:integration host factor subunit alpha